MPVLAPANIQEVLDFGLHGYAMSRASGLWVGLKLVNDVADSCASADVSPERVRPILPEATFRDAPLEVRPMMNEAGGMMLESEQRIHDVRLQVARDSMSSSSVRTATVKWSARIPDVMKTFSPLRT